MKTIRDPATGRTVTMDGPAPTLAPARALATDMVLRADLQRQQAKLIESAGFATFDGLYDGDRRVRAMLTEGKFGASWLLDKAEADARGRKWVTAGPTSRQQKAMGLKERRELDRAEAVIVKGRVILRRLGDRWGSDAELKFS